MHTTTSIPATFVRSTPADSDRRRAEDVRRPAALAAAVRGEVGHDQLADHLSGLDLTGECGLDLWAAHLEDVDYRAETVAAYLGEVYMFTDWYAQRHPGEDIGQASAEEFRTYRDHLTDQGLSSTTVRVALASLRTYYKGRDDLTGPLPIMEMPLPKAAPPRPRAYARSEVNRLLAGVLMEARAAEACGDLRAALLAYRDHTMIAVLYYAGLRQREVRRLVRANIRLEQEMLDFVGKGGKPRTVTIPPVLVAILTHYLTYVRPHLGPYEHVFSELDGIDPDTGAAVWRDAGPATNLNRLRTQAVVQMQAAEDASFGLGQWTINNRLYRHARRAGLDGPHSSHRLRHTHASACLQAGMSLEDVAKRLGHELSGRGAWQPTTYRYLHLPADFLADLTDQIFADPKLI